MAKRAREPVDWQARAETLAADLERVEALAHAAEEALQALPIPRGRAGRLAAGRVYALVSAAAREARRAGTGRRG